MDRDYLIQDIYQAAAGQADWDDIAASIREDIGLASVLFAYAFDIGDIFQIHESNYSRDIFSGTPFTTQMQFDPAFNVCVTQILRSLAGRTFDQDKTLPQDDVQKEFERFALQRPGLSLPRVFRLGATDYVAGGFFANGSSKSEYDRRQLRRMDIVTGHLSRAFHLALVIGESSRQLVSFTSIFNHISIGAAIIDQDFLIHQRNERFESFVEEDTRLTIKRGRLVIEQGLERKSVLRILTEAPFSDGRSEHKVLFRSDGINQPLDLSLFPGVDSRGRSVFRSETTLVLIRRASQSPALPAKQKLIYQFGFDPVEAEVLRLLPSGLSLDEIAERTGHTFDDVNRCIRSAEVKLGLQGVLQVALFMDRLR